MSFIQLITKKKRESFLSDIAERFLLLYKESLGIGTAVLTTATSIDEDTRKNVIDFIKKQGISQVDLTEKVDESLIGGAILRLGDKQLDASISRQIKDLKQSFNKNLYIKDF
jgi:F-type H+-transporting ATPase subunit delta